MKKSRDEKANVSLFLGFNSNLYLKTIRKRQHTRKFQPTTNIKPYLNRVGLFYAKLLKIASAVFKNV